MTASVRTFATVDDMAVAAVDRIVDDLTAAGSARRRYLLGCPGGRTPRPVYQEWGRRAAIIGFDCSHVVVVMMDDYLDSSSPSPQLVDQTLHFSCRRFAENEIRQVVNQHLPPTHQISVDNVWMPDPVDPAAYDRRIAEAGGIDLFLVASGASDGHVAFCGPGADLDGGTSIVELADETRVDNMVTFPGFNDLSEVPTHGVSVGLGTIRRSSQEVLLLLHGHDKRESARRMADGYTAQWPATFIHECVNGEIWMDAAARVGNRK